MLNRAILMGRLTADPDLRQTPNGVSVVTFSLAVSRNYNRDQTDFINIVAWRQTAEFVSKYFKKGQLVAVEGAIQTRSYTDQAGNKRTAFEVVADQVYFAESKGGAKPAVHDFPMPSEMDEPAKGTSFSIGNIEDYEEIDTDDGDLPF
ncbi:MAG: single-stranded DNA-binding protein [Massiliimalia sp.]|jgi:single-strand DNA-binding protein